MVSALCVCWWGGGGGGGGGEGEGKKAMRVEKVLKIILAGANNLMPVTGLAPTKYSTVLRHGAPKRVPTPTMQHSLTPKLAL